MCMEYLSRVLGRVGEQKAFKYHPRCNGVKLHHLAFADDLIVCSRGNKDGVQLLLRGLATFTAASGLVANSGKSNVYFCNVDEDTKSYIISKSGFAEGQFLKYLGVNVSAKKLTVDDCQVLVDKMVSKIRKWGSKTMSYTARTQLVNSVLIAIQSYWANIFILPKKVIDQVMAICRNFIWDGRAVYSRAPPVAWDIVCRPNKKQGGLGVLNCHRWNVAAIGKYVWDIANKNESLWLKWVNHHYIKGRNWKRMPCPTSASWQWKQVWKVKEQLK